MQQYKESFWDKHALLTGLIVLAGTAATTMTGAYVPSSEIGKPATFLFWFVLTALAAFFIFGLRFGLERINVFARLSMSAKICLTWAVGVLLFAPFSELIDLAVGLSTYPDIPTYGYNLRANLLLEGVIHEAVCSAVPMLYMAILFDILWFSRIQGTISVKAETTESETVLPTTTEEELEVPIQLFPKKQTSLRFLERSKLPNDASVLHIEAQQHYIMVNTDHGKDLVYYRFGDAIAELEECSGLQVHRSHWISEQAVRNISKKSRTMEIELLDGQKIPVSRNRQHDLKNLGWLAKDFTKQHPNNPENSTTVYDQVSFA